MKLSRILMGLAAVVVVSVALMASSCEVQPTSTTGVGKATAEVKTQADGLTIEQKNVMDRLQMENVPGKVMHLYILSAYSGQVIMYSSVKGKVTSSGKRLTPYTSTGAGEYGGSYFEVPHSGGTFRTSEVLQDDGVYGDSVTYIFWWDLTGAYHQQYIQGGMILHITDKPLSGVHSVGINLSND